jgi:hypothetical protein
MVLYGFAGLQLARNPRRTPRANSAQEAFAQLADALKTAIPSLPTGFTWREGIERAMTAGVRVDWQKLSAELGSYEEFRYGGRGAPTSEYSEVTSLTRALHEVAPS